MGKNEDTQQRMRRLIRTGRGKAKADGHREEAMQKALERHQMQAEIAERHFISRLEQMTTQEIQAHIEQEISRSQQDLADKLSDMEWNIPKRDRSESQE